MFYRKIKSCEKVLDGLPFEKNPLHKCQDLLDTGRDKLNTANDHHQKNYIQSQ